MLPAGLVLLAVWLAVAAADDVSCSETLPCAIGCCGKWGVCGTGPDYCGSDVCINNCDAKAECNPGDWADEYVNATTCPLNVCCSKYGFCGTTEDFCGDSPVTRPSCDIDSQSIKRVIGYYSSGGASRSCNGMIPTSFPQGVYSHVYFAFVSINPDTYQVIPESEGDYLLYQQLRMLQTRDLGQELWLSIGGWDFSDSNFPTATTFSDLVGAPLTQQNVFFVSLTNFMATWGFKGVDIDWEYPAAKDRNGRDEDYANYPAFLANLRAALDHYNYGLSVTLPTSYWYLQHFDLVSIEPSVDWFNYMSYDLHGTWDIGNKWTGATINAHTNLTEIETALDLLWRNNITSSKVNLGLASYGRSITLESPSCSEPGCVYLSAGDKGECSDQAGILFNSEIGQIIKDQGLTPTLYKDAAVKTITWNNDQWVSYDDEDTWKIKADFAKSQCLGGVLIWAVDYDDSTNSFSRGLAAALGNDVNVDISTGLTLSLAITPDKRSESSQDSYCRFINCGETCPSGFTEITRDDKKSQLMLDSTQCPQGSKQTQTLCCPTSTDVPACRWRGFHNNGKCKGGCNSDEAEVGTITSGCKSGYQSACCTITDSTKPWSECSWTNDCHSDNTCPSGFGEYVVESRDGWGGRKPCGTEKKRNYCCKNAVPDAFTNCDWYGHQMELTNTAYCTNTCPSGSIRIAAQELLGALYTDRSKAHTSDCYWGTEAYCCSGPTETSSDKDPRSNDPFVYQDQTASDFDAYLQKFLAAPVCPGDWDAQYGSNDEGLSERDVRPQVLGGLLRGRATDQSITLTFLLPIVATWITSQYPRSDLTDIWEYRLDEFGYGSDGANFSVIEDTLYGGSWSTYPMYTPQALAADVLCNIASSSNGLQNVAAASVTLCFEPPEGGEARGFGKQRRGPDGGAHELSERNLVLGSEQDRANSNTQPTVIYALEGVIAGNLSLHYIRWLNTNNRLTLELAYWMGPQVGVNDTTVRNLWGDSTHTAATDRWIVFHLHIPVDQHTFLTGEEAQGYYPGVTTMDLYHGQGIRRVGAVTTGAVASHRVEYRYAIHIQNIFLVFLMLPWSHSWQGHQPSPQSWLPEWAHTELRYVADIPAPTPGAVIILVTLEIIIHAQRLLAAP